MGDGVAVRAPGAIGIGEPLTVGTAIGVGAGTGFNRCGPGPFMSSIDGTV